jgi:hypothetical protein
MTHECDDGEGCDRAPDYECVCPRCAREPVHERYHACAVHLIAANAMHKRARGIPASWSSFQPWTES